MSAVQFTAYNEDGDVLFNGTCAPEDLAFQATATGLFIVEGWADQETEYISGGVVTAREEMAASVVGTTIVDLPPGAVVTVNRVDVFELPEGETEIEFEFSEPGLYVCDIKAPAYLKMTLEIEVS